MKQLWHKIPGFHCDTEKFCQYVQKLKDSPATKIKSKVGVIKGWAITSKKDSIDYGVKKILTKENIRKVELVYPTPLCYGYVREIIVDLALCGFFLSRVRVVALAPMAEMGFHKDGIEGEGGQAWRVHIPIMTNKKAKMQWLCNKKQMEKHFPADGSAYVVNVSENHRAINLSKVQTRYHLVATILRCNKSYKFWNNPYLY